jgi:dethiobiotin synthetase
MVEPMPRSGTVAAGQALLILSGRSLLDNPLAEKPVPTQLPRRPDWTVPVNGIFITSVGTGIGKTLVTTILCHQLKTLGRKTSAVKPVVSGFLPDDPASDPALILRSLGKTPEQQTIAAIAPWRFALPVSPHLAARREGGGPQLADVVAFCREQERAGGDLLLVEGAGGVMAPLGEIFTCLDLIESLGYPVILVTGTYLGAISHTLTALDTIRRRKIPIQGIVISESAPSAGLADTLESLEQFGGAGVRLYALPRLSGSDDEKWRTAPSLIGLSDQNRVTAPEAPRAKHGGRNREP